MNMSNFGIAEGRLSKDPYVVVNKDNSQKVIITLAIQDNFVSRNGQKNTQYPTFEAFIPKDKNTGEVAKLGVYGLVQKGDKIGIQYSLRTPAPYTDKDGKTVYPETHFIEAVEIKEPKSVTDKRHADRAAAEAQNDAQAAPEPAPQAEEGIDEEQPFK